MNIEKKLTEPVQAARSYFKSGFSCSEAVLKAFNEAYNLGLPEEYYKIASPFGAGMGESGCACGAVAACTMAFGLIAGRKNARETNSLAFLAASELQKRFKEAHKAICCRILTRNAEWKSAERKELCDQYITDAATIADDIIKNQLADLLPANRQEQE